MPYGLKDIELEKLSKVFAANERIERVVLYGSRAKGNYKPFSDVDITMMGSELTHTDLNRISFAIDDLLLPYQFDISIFHTLKNEALIDHILRVGITIYERESEWKEYKLGEIAEIMDFKRIPLSSMQRANRKGQYPYYGASGIIDYLDDYIFEGEHVLISEDGENLRSRQTPIAFLADGKFWVNNHAHIVKSDYVHNRLICYFFANLDLNPYITGAVQPKLSQDSLKRIPLFLPESLEKRKEIVSILTSLDDKIDLLRRESATLEAMAETLFKQWFVAEAKEEWEEKPLSFFGRIVCGKTPPKKESKYFGGGIPFIKIPDMHKNTFVFDSEDSLTEEGKLYQPDKTLPPFSIIVSCIATVGLVVLNAKEAQTNQQINSIIPYKDEYRYYLYLHLKNLYDELNAMASGGTATLNLNTGNFSKIPICYPGVDMLIVFHKQVKGVFEKIYYNQKQINTLIQTRDGLLPRLMSNEIKI